MTSPLIITLDGHSSCGKSTLAKQLSKHFGYKYIDTGAMYRSVTLYAIEKGLFDKGALNEAQLVESLKSIGIDFRFNEKTQSNETYLNGVNVEQKIRSLEVANKVSLVATIKAVREEMVLQQQAMGKGSSLVMDGRDIGTVVFPEAQVKFFMTASSEVRAQRRFDEMRANGDSISYDEVLKNVVERDRIDSTRKESPLAQANDAILLDNSFLTPEEQFAWAAEKVQAVLNH